MNEVSYQCHSAIFYNHLPRLFPRNLDTRLNFIETSRIQSIVNYQDRRVALQCLIRSDLEVLQSVRKGKVCTRPCMQETNHAYLPIALAYVCMPHTRIVEP